MSAKSNVERSGAQVSASEIQVLASEICQLARTTGFERRLSIGELVWRRLFDDCRSEAEMGAKQPQLTLRRLAKALDGSISKSDLHRCISTLLICRALPFVPASGHLTIGHVDAVAGLPHPVQSELLHCAEANRWSCRQLRQARRNAIKANPTSPALRRPGWRMSAKMPTVQRMTSQLARLSTLLNQGRHEGFDGKELTHLEQSLTAIREACEHLTTVAVKQMPCASYKC